METITIDFLGEDIELRREKVDVNMIRVGFSKLESEESESITSHFYEKFQSLDDLYEKSDYVAHEILNKALDLAMRYLASYEIYEVAEKDFYSKYSEAYITWNEDFELVAKQYEKIIQDTAEIDAYRTFRRKNRTKWIGFDRESINEADAKNFNSNIRHGVFNLMAKGVTAIGNSIKKNEIFRSESTVSHVAKGVINIVHAVFLGTVDAINEFKPGSLYCYSEEDVLKTNALVENAKKGRIPREKILSSLIHAVEIYPYNRGIYFLLLCDFGSDGGKLDALVDYFGLSNLDGEKKKLFDEKVNSAKISSISDFNENSENLRNYANFICYSKSDCELDKLLSDLKEIDFKNEVKKYSINTIDEYNKSICYLKEYAEKINYAQFVSWASELRKTIDDANRKEETKQQKQMSDHEDGLRQSKFMQFMTSKDPAVEKKRGIIFAALIFFIFIMRKCSS